MAASTITRATITDDSGAGTDGTIINSAWVGTALYDKIDLLFSTSNPVQYEKSVDGEYTLTVKNTSTGTAAAALIRCDNDSGPALRLAAFGGTFTTSGANIQDGCLIRSQVQGGLSVQASHASGQLRFYAGASSTEQMRLNAAGHLVLNELSANPGTSDLTADAALAVYTKADKLVFAYNNGGVMTYITLDLDGSDTTLTHGTSAP